MKQKCDFKYTGAMVLGMHDALVELSGIIAGLTFAIADRRVIILTAAIAGIAASLSMAAANFQAQRADGNGDALRAAAYTGLAYVGTCTALILPFVVVPNRFGALMMLGVIATLIIFGFNCAVASKNGRPFMRQFLEMLGICFGVSLVSFFIGIAAKYFMGVSI